MEGNQLFQSTRLRLAAGYMLVMGFTLGISGFGVYQAVKTAYRETIDEGLESVANALNRSIEPIWQQPGNLKQITSQLSLALCTTPTSCLTNRAVVKNSLVDSVNYYMRLLERSGKPFASAGTQLGDLPLTAPQQRWQTLTDRSGVRYRQITLPLRSHQQLLGYLQVGRSINDLERHLAALRLTLWLGYPISLIFVGICSWWLAGVAMQPVYRSYRQIEQFTADAAHEFCTPLAAMHSTIEAAYKLYGQPGSGSLSPPVTTGILDVLKRQNKRLSQLVGDLLLLTRIDREQLSKERQPCVLNDLISDLVDELAFLAVEAQVELGMQISAEVSVLGNEEQLYRAIANLMTNAIQATPSGGKVTVALSCNDRYALIQVQDTGIGIAVEHQQRIFDRFYRIDTDRSRTSGGSGLGLAIASAIARSHQGSIQVQSQLKVGSTFTVSLPLD